MAHFQEIDTISFHATCGGRRIIIYHNIKRQSENITRFDQSPFERENFKESMFELRKEKSYNLIHQTGDVS